MANSQKEKLDKKALNYYNLKRLKLYFNYLEQSNFTQLERQE